ncbi:MAG: thioredoxin family protein [Bacteroidetes bacterium]|jgi:thioredoxin 1|nr:thioredoxin family protein [Bacteroidota bacterium]
MIEKLNDATFQQALRDHDKVVVKYYASWCGSCRLIAPKYAALADKPEYAGVYFVEVDAEESPEARKTAGVTNLPFFAAFNGGTLTEGFASGKAEAVETLAATLLNN